MASPVKAAIVAALASGQTMTAEELRVALKAPNAKSIRSIASKMATDGVLEQGRRRLGPGPRGVISVFRLRTARSLQSAGAGHRAASGS